ncbi:unnamed protein product [Ilex paraguariensis]|uniref:Uncharacterized protein n=1 Tax=Ilex paraguariensis TaxID=185542 RepID=A0ABC8U5K5_9AQUA
MGGGDSGPILFVQAMNINSAPKEIRVNNNAKTLSTSSKPSKDIPLSGEQMQVTDYYYIEWPLFRPRTVVQLVSGGNETCPLDVGPRTQLVGGIPARISPVNSDDGVVRESTDLNIKFVWVPPCAQSGVWNVQYDEESEEYFVRVGGVEGNPDCETITNWFKIEKLGDYYKLVFCPSVCNNHYCNAICKDVGRDSEGRFVLSDTPYRIGFRKFELLKSKISYQY